MELLLDTRTRSVRLALLEGVRPIARRTFSATRPERILPALDRFLASESAVRRLRRIVVVDGPGQFSYLRTGIVIGNALARTLGVPLARIRAADPVSPIPATATQGATLVKRLVPYYGHRPSITLN